mmetsp:Transcript_31869/g.92147  ORF Transcript_31869/g.92147 Transcript_31869/m.92147 type:complete len:289 (+) Transcript_31869:441-1307(+)
MSLRNHCANCLLCSIRRSNRRCKWLWCSMRRHWRIGRNLRTASRTHLLHHEPRPQTIDVEDMVAGQLFRLRAFEKRVTADDTKLVTLNLLILCIRKACVHIEGDPTVAPEGAQTLSQLPSNLDHVRHHVDRQPGWVLNKEREHEHEEERHGQHIVDQVDVKQAHRLSWPTVVQAKVHHVHQIFANGHNDHSRHRESLEQNPGEESRRARGHAVKVLQGNDVATEQQAHEGDQLHLDDEARNANLEHVRYADLCCQMEHLHEDDATNILDEVNCSDLAIVDGGCIEDQE